MHGTGHVMVRFNLKSETIGRPFEVSRLSKPVPSTNYDYINFEIPSNPCNLIGAIYSQLIQFVLLKFYF